MARYLTGLMSIAVLLGAVGIASAANVVPEDFTGSPWVTTGQAIVGTNGWTSSNSLVGKLVIGGGPGHGFNGQQVNAVSSNINSHLPLLHHVISGGPVTSGTISGTVYANSGNSGFTHGMSFGFNDTDASAPGGLFQLAIKNAANGELSFRLGPIPSQVVPSEYTDDDWHQVRFTYDRDANTVSLDYRLINDTTGAPSGTWNMNVYGADLDDHSLAPRDVTHFFIATASDGSMVAFPGMDIPEPAGLALLGAGSVLLLRRRRRI